MSTHITKTQAEALATFVNRIRTDWDHPGIVAAIAKAIDKGSPLDVAHALLTLAEDEQLRSPALLPADGRHWVRRDGRPTGPRLSHNVPCPDHPTEHDMPCPHPPEPIDPAVIASLAAQARAGMAAKPYVPPAVRQAQAQETSE